MDFSFEVGENEKHTISFHRNQFWGNIHISVDGKKTYQTIQIMSLNLDTTYKVNFGVNELHEVRIVKTRPLLFAAFRPHQYSVFVDDTLVNKYTGF